jgi:hypothetical protein
MKRYNRRAENRKIVIEVCDEYLGRIDRGRTTMSALKVAKAMTTQGPIRARLDKIWERMKKIWHEPASSAEVEAVFYSGADSDDNAYLAVFNTSYEAFDEIERRLLFGQEIDNDTLGSLCRELAGTLIPYD